MLEKSSMKRLGVHLLVVTLLAVQARAVPLSSFFNYEGDSVLPRSQAASSQVLLANTFRHDGQDFTSVYVTSNGLLSLGSDFTMPSVGEFPSGSSLVAPFWTSYDYSQSGQVYYRESATVADLAKANLAVRAALGDASLSVTSVLVVTWENVQGIGDPSQTNTFQCILAGTRGSLSYIITYYLSGGMQVAGTPFATVGLSSGESNTTLPLSGTDRVLDIAATGNSGEAGLWIWRADTMITLPGVILGWDQTTQTVGEESGSLEVCVSLLNGVLTSSVSVSIVTGSSSADDGDYSLSSRVLSLFNSHRECIAVTINNDIVFEGEEQIRLTLESTSNIVLLPQQTVISIQDNDDVVVAPFSSSMTVSEEEGLVQLCGVIMNSNGGIATSQKNITVFYSTNSVTAQGGEDFTSVTNGELAFIERSTACVAITIQNDRIFENDETFTFSFSANPSQQAVTVDTAVITTVTIQDDDARNVELSFDQRSYTVMEGGSVTACVLITSSGQLGGSLNVTLRTRRPEELIQGSVRAATNGLDFAGDSMVVEFNPSNMGEQQCLTISVLDDTFYEGEELFGFEIYKQDTLGVSIPRSRATVSLEDNDEIQFSLLQSEYNFSEGEDSDNVRICLNRTGEMEWTIILRTTLTEGTATFVSATNRGDVSRNIDDIIFMPEETVSCTLIEVVDDHYFETDVETLTVTVNYFDSLVSFPISSASVSIHDDDDVEIEFFFLTNDVDVREEDNIQDTIFYVSQTGQVDIPVSVALVPINGTATEHEDYEARGEFIRFENAISSDIGEPKIVEASTISVTLLDDPVVEGIENLVLQLVPMDPRVRVSENSIARVTIRENDEVIVGFTEQLFAVHEGDGNIEVCLFLQGFSTKSFSVEISTRDGTAKKGVDFDSNELVIVLPPTSPDVLTELYKLSPSDRLSATKPKSNPQCTTITIIDDDVAEVNANKQLDLSLVPIDPRVVVDRTTSSATIAIQDDDFLVIALESDIISVSEDVGSVRICARLDGEADFDINALLQTFSGSAQASDDYVSSISPITFPAHSTDPQCADFTIIDDNFLENPEEFVVELLTIASTSQVTTGVNRTMTVVISDNDFVEVEFERIEYSEEEGNVVQVCALLRGVAVREISATLSTRPSMQGAQATPNVDYNAITNITLFNGGISLIPSRKQCVSISLDDDDILENTESFQMFLSSEDSGVRTTAASVADVYILDNDGVRMGIQEREYEVMETQSVQPICVELIGRIQKSINVALSTSPGTARGDADYSSVRSIEVIFQASDRDNQTLCTDFTIYDDLIYEESETFTISLSTAEGTTGVGLHIPSATVTIIDDDDVSIRFDSSAYNTREEEFARVCLRMTGRSEAMVECLVSAQPDSATQDDQADFIYSNPLSIVFNDSLGTSRGCASIGIVDDQILENTEQFTVIVTCGGPRVFVTDNTSTVNIIDNDSVSVGFVELHHNVSEDVESERSVTICVELSGEIEKNATVTIATESSNSPLGVATANDDYLPFEENVEFSPNQENKTHCVTVTVLDDRYVESVEVFDVIVTGVTARVNTPESTKKVTIAIYDEDVVCLRGGTDTSRGFFEWPEAFPNDVVVIECVNGTATRRCSSEGIWGPPEVDSCYASVEAILIHVIKSLPNDDGLSKDYLRELINALHRLRVENPAGLRDFIKPIYAVLYEYSQNVTNDVATIDSETHGLILTVADILLFPEWPYDVVQAESVTLIRAVESITDGLIKVGGFSSLNENRNYLGYSIEKDSFDKVFPVNQLRRKTVTFVRLPDAEIVSRLSASRDKEGTFLSSISLPLSISSRLRDDNVGLYFGYYENSVMFPIIISNSTEILTQPASHEVSPIIMATVSEQSIDNLKEPVNFTISVGNKNYSDPVCVSWDFSAVGNRGNWTTRGCKLVSDNDGIISCSCTHLTNFAVILDVRAKPAEGPLLQRPILSTIVIVGVGISLLGLALTVITLLLFSKLRKRDSTVIRIQFCLSVALMLIAFVCGIARVEIFQLCVAISALIHYFTLVAMMWLAAEAVLMLQKLISTANISAAYFVIASLICWVLPIPAVVVPIGIDRGYIIHEQYCFISHSVVFYASFLGPIAGILIFDLILFFVAFIVVLRYSAKHRRSKSKLKRRRAAVRTIFTIIAVLIVLCLTWLFGAFTVLRATVYTEYLFVIFNSLLGLNIFLIFVVFAKETRDLWLVTCGCKEKKSKGGLEAYSRRVSRNPSLRKTGDEIDSDDSYDYDDADNLEALKAFDKEARLNVNSWDVMYIMPQNTFDIFLNSDQFQQPSFPVASNSIAFPIASSKTSQAQVTVHTPTSDINVLEDQSVADSGISVDQLKSKQSPKRLPGEPITTVEESEKKRSCHVHSVSGIGYVSADSDDEFLDRTSPPVLASPPTRKRSRAFGDRFTRELHSHRLNSEQDSEIEMVTTDFQIDIAP